MRKYGPKEKVRAFEMYLNGKKLRAIGEELGVPYGTIHNWHSRLKWADRRKHIETESVTETADLFNKNVKTVVNQGLLRLAKKNMEILDLIDKEATRLREKPNSKDLLTLTKACEKHYKLYQRMILDVISTSVTSM